MRGKPTWGRVVPFALAIFLGLNVLIAQMNAAAQDDSISLEVIWKTDTAAHSIMGGCNIAIDGQGNTYVTDYGVDGHTYQIVVFDHDGEFVTSWGETGTGPGQFDWRPANPDQGPDAGFVAADEEGTVYVSDGYNFRVQKFNNNGEFVLEWGSQGEDAGQFVPPSAGPIAVSPEGLVVMSDFAHVQLFDSEGQFLNAFGSAGSSEGEFTGAAQVAWDSRGNIYVADLLNARYQKFDPDLDFLLQWGVSGEGDGELFRPLYVAVDSQDHVFATDNTGRLQAFDAEGNFVGVWTEPGNGDSAYENVSAVVVDDEDNLYVAAFREQDGCVIYKLRQV